MGNWVLSSIGIAIVVMAIGIWRLRFRRARIGDRGRQRIPPNWQGYQQVRHLNQGKRIGILVVAYNALTTLSSVLKRIPPEVWDEIEEVAIFDDASPDQTYELAVGIKTLFGMDKLTILRNERNLGYGGNQKRGYQYFMDKGFDAVVMLHGDGQYAPEVLANLYAPIIAGEADAVFGSRMVPDYGGPLRGGMPFYKYIGNKILTCYANYFLKMKLAEFHCGYRAYSLAALRNILLDDMTNDFHFDTQIIIKLNHQGYRIKEVAIPTYYGGEICYVNGMKYAWNVFSTVVRYRRMVRGLASCPEYGELAAHYPLKESKYSSHYYFRRIAGHNQDILDLGCGEGFFAATIAGRGNVVVGFDSLPQVRQADALAKYISVDLDRGFAEAIPRLEGRQFDLVLLQDVLEHLRFPERVLADCTEVLKPHGRIAVSVPNVANIIVRFSLLLGRFEYTPRGTLDRTHLRFFTRRSARRLLEQAGYEVLGQQDSVMPVELALGLSARNLMMRWFNRLLALATALVPGLLGYQTILIARPRSLANRVVFNRSRISMTPVRPSGQHRSRTEKAAA